MSSHDKRQAAVIAFEQWRKARTHRAAKTPELLRQQALNLLPYFLISQITLALKLSHAQLRNWSNVSSSITPVNPSFVALPELNESS